MIPILYDKGETDFTNNGLGRLADCLSCTVTEERNGIYECKFSYPVSGDMYPQIQEGRIVGVIHDDAHDIQPFDIYSRSAPLNGVVTFYAHHISYRLGNIILKPMSASSCAAALNAIPNNTYTECPFTFWTDKSASRHWKNEVPSAVKALLGGQDGSILDVFGAGEYEWDKWAVKLHASRGNDNGVAIRYGVNLTDLQHDIDISGAYTGAVPFWMGPEGGTVVTLDEGYVKVSVPQLVPWTDNNGDEIVDDQGRVIYANVENSAALLKMTAMDLSDAFEDQPTQAQLRAEAQRRLANSEAWLPSENIKVSFIDLAHTEEYKDVAALQRVKLCDRVSVYCGPLGVSAVSMQVIRVVFNVLTERYDEIELGKAKTSFAQTITADVEHIVEDKASVSMMQKAINNATEQITGAKGGHILDIFDANGKRQEIVIMDTEDVNTAVKVWRMNMGGFGFSRNGYAGPYGIAITQDGKIVADFITTGTLIANIIKAGILSDSAGKNYWNMETGEFSLAATATVGGSTVDSIAQGKANTAEANAKSYADGAVDTLDDSLNQQSVFNRLTNNGQTQGIYLKNGKLYVNATYIDTGTLVANLIKGGTLTLGGSNNTNGTLVVKDSNNNTVGSWANTGIELNKGSINLSNNFIVDTSGQATTKSLTATDYVYVNGGSNSYFRIPCDISDFVNNYIEISNSGAVFSNTNSIMKITTAPTSAYGFMRITSRATGDTYGSYLDYNVIYSTTGSGYAGLSGGSISVSSPDVGNVFAANKNWCRIYPPTTLTNSLTVQGTKSRAVITDQYSERLLYCYETPSPMFGDVGEGTIGEDGKCYIWLDPVFAQTVTTTQYQVFLQRYGEGECYVKERRGGCFIVAGTPGMAFGWEVKAKQRDFDQRRLERNDEPFTVPTVNYGADAAEHINDIRKDREAA